MSLSHNFDDISHNDKLKLKKIIEQFPADVYRKDGDVCIDVALAGFEKDDVELSFDKNQLTVSAMKEMEADRESSMREIAPP